MRWWSAEWWPIGRARRQADFREFFAALPRERSFCISCLAILAGTPEPLVRRELQALSTRIEAQVTSCWTCEQSQTTYRLRTPLSARTVSDSGPSIVLMILDRPTCPDCIAFRKSITVDQVKAALDVIADVVNVCRESGTCRV